MALRERCCLEFRHAEQDPFLEKGRFFYFRSVRESHAYGVVELIHREMAV
jgi:hypothetical protein